MKEILIFIYVCKKLVKILQNASTYENRNGRQGKIKKTEVTNLEEWFHIHSHIAAGRF
jgi:hypothetical protein